jgi:putative ABC transport system permease protein
MRLLEFFKIALQRLSSRKLLSLLVFLTMALTVAITVCIPVFAGAVSLEIIRQEIDRRSEIKGLPLFSVRITAEPVSRHPLDLTQIMAARDRLGDLMRRTFDLPLLEMSVEVESPVYRLTPRSGDTTYTTQYLAGVRVVAIQDVAEHIEIVEGRPFGTPSSDPGTLSVWIEQVFLNELAMGVGEVYILGGIYTSAADGIPVEIAGSYRVLDVSNTFRGRSLEGRYLRDMLTSEEQFGQHVSPRLEEGASFVAWHYVFDERQVNLSRAPRYIAGLRSIEREAQRTLPSGEMGIAPLEELLRGSRRKTSLSIVLFGFSLPILLFLIYFAASLSAMQARYQEQELATIVSRGCNAVQVLGLAGAETAVLIALAIPTGTLTGLLLARSLGYAGGFLTFIQRDPLQVSLASVDWLPVVAIVSVNLLVRLAAAWRVRSTTIVTYSHLVGRQKVFKTLTRYFYVLLLAGVTAYAYRHLQLRGTLALTSLDAFDPRNDPLLLLAPTLFLFSAPLLATELFMLLVAPLGFLGRFFRGVWGYLALQNLARDGGRYRTPIYALVLSLSMGVFYASMAKSADIWLIDSMRYAYGADLTFRIGYDAGDGAQPTSAPQVLAIPDDAYRTIGGVEGVSRVGDFRATIHGRVDLPHVRLLAVNRVTLPEVIYFRSDYVNGSLGELMNRLAEVPNGILVSSELLRTLMLGVGDPIRLNVNIQGNTLLPFEFRVVGTFDYFPTMYPDVAAVLITNLDHLEFVTVYTLPYAVWMRLESGIDRASVIRGVRQLLLLVPSDVADLDAALGAERVRLERTGIFGMLSVCFLAGAVLSIANLLVQNTLLLHERSLRHAILRALGLGRSDVLRMVVLEGMLALLYSLILGVLSGVACANLYVPYFALGRTSGRPIPPFVPVIDWSGTQWIATVMLIGMLLAEAFVLARMIRARLFEALRMGNMP